MAKTKSTKDDNKLVGVRIGYTIPVTGEPDQFDMVHSFAAALQEPITDDEPRVDTLELTLKYEENAVQKSGTSLSIPTKDGETSISDIGSLSFTAEVFFYPYCINGHTGLALKRNGRVWRLGGVGVFAPEVLRRVAERNQLLGIVLDEDVEDEKDIESASEYTFNTSQEMDALHRAQCNGKTFAGYQINDQAGDIVFERSEGPHLVRLSLTDDEKAAGLALTHLEQLVRSQDADAMLATEYILRVLAPAPHLRARSYAGGWIDFDDVIAKIGWDPRTTKDRREMHARIWEFIKFGERAHIVGKRSGTPYKDAHGTEFDTTVHGAIWRVMKTETPDQRSFFEVFETPIRAEIVVSKELTALLTNSKLAQYLEGAEMIGSIPGGKPSGAWARVIGPALLSFWRRHSQGAIDGSFTPTRRELLERYTAKVKPYQEILDSKNPARAIEYWCGALNMLADSGLLERTGEVLRTQKEIRSQLPSQGWDRAWLDEKVHIEPNSLLMRPRVLSRAKSLPVDKPRNLQRKNAPKRARKTQ